MKRTFRSQSVVALLGGVCGPSVSVCVVDDVTLGDSGWRSDLTDSSVWVAVGRSRERGSRRLRRGCTAAGPSAARGRASSIPASECAVPERRGGVERGGASQAVGAPAAGAEDQAAEQGAGVGERAARASRHRGRDEGVGEGEADGAGHHGAGDRGDVPGEEEEDERAAHHVEERDRAEAAPLDDGHPPRGDAHADAHDQVEDEELDAHARHVAQVALGEELGPA